MVAEAWSDAVELRPGDRVIAVTAEACYELSRRKIPFETVSRLAPESELDDAAHRLWPEELGWFDHVDGQLRHAIPQLGDLGVRPAWLSAYYLKLLLDAVFIAGFQARAITERADAPLLLVVADAPDPPVDHRLYFRGRRTLLLRLLPRFCESAGLAWAEHLVSTSAEAAGVPAHNGRLVLGALGAVRRVKATAARVSDALRRTCGRPHRRLTLLFLHHNAYDLPQVLQAARRRGHRCLAANGQVVLDVSVLAPRLAGELGSEPDPKHSKAAEAAVSAVEVWRWPNAWYGVPVSDLLMPHVRFWARHFVPAILAEMRDFARVFDEFDVDFVLMPYAVGATDYAALAAKGRCATQAVLLEHGDAAFSILPPWELALLPFDHYFATHTELAAAFRALRGPSTKPEVHVASYRWREAARLARKPALYVDRPGDGPHRVRLASPLGGVKRRRPIVVYALTTYRWDVHNVENFWYSDPWHYLLQARIVDVFADDPRYTFVIKTFPGDVERPTPIARYVGDLGVSHLVVSRAPLTQWFPRADRILFDWPSTGIYEAALAGVPFLTLAHERMRLRPDALEKLGSRIRRFSSADEAAVEVARFLDAEVSPERLLRPERHDLIQTLERLRAEAGGES